MRVNIGIVTRLRPGRMRDRGLIPDGERRLSPLLSVQTAVWDT